MERTSCRSVGAQTDCRMPADWRSKIISTLSQRFSVTQEWLVIVPGDDSHIQTTFPQGFDSGCLVYRSSTSTAAVLHQACRHFLAHIVAVKDCVVMTSVLCCRTHSGKSGMHEKLVYILVSLHLRHDGRESVRRSSSLQAQCRISGRICGLHDAGSLLWWSIQDSPALAIISPFRLTWGCLDFVLVQLVPERTTVRWLRHPAESRTMWHFLDFSPLPDDMNVRGVWVQATMCLGACGSPSSATPQSGWQGALMDNAFMFASSGSLTTVQLQWQCGSSRNFSTWGMLVSLCTQQIVEWKLFKLVLVGIARDSKVRKWALTCIINWQYLAKWQRVYSELQVNLEERVRSSRFRRNSVWQRSTRAFQSVEKLSYVQSFRLLAICSCVCRTSETSSNNEMVEKQSCTHKYRTLSRQSIQSAPDFRPPILPALECSLLCSRRFALLYFCGGRRSRKLRHCTAWR